MRRGLHKVTKTSKGNKVVNLGFHSYALCRNNQRLVSSGKLLVLFSQLCLWKRLNSRETKRPVFLSALSYGWSEV